MRTLLIALVLANLALLGLGQGWFGQPPALRGREPERLRHEIRPDAIQVPAVPGVNAPPAPDPRAPADDHPAGADAATGAGTPAEASTDAGADTDGKAPAGEAAPATPQPPPPPDVSPGDAPPPLPRAPGPDDSVPAAAAPHRAGDDPPPTAVPAQATAQGATTAPAATPPAPGAALACVEWGSFDATTLRQAQSWAAQALPGVALHTRTEPGTPPAKPGWIVLVGPAASESAARTQLAQLTQLGIGDLFLIQADGPYRNAISLGVFSSREAAGRHAQAMGARGAKQVKVAERFPAQKRTWLVLRRVDAAAQQALAQAPAALQRVPRRACGR